MTPQRAADNALARWQQLRALSPEERIRALVADFFVPPLESDAEYEITLNTVAEEMSRAA
jgi:23S rRNA A2030 N6-methylase RlmJ